MEEYMDEVYQTRTEQLSPEQMADDLIATAEFIQKRVAAGTYSSVPKSAQEYLGLTEDEIQRVVDRIRRRHRTTEWLNTQMDRLLAEAW